MICQWNAAKKRIGSDHVTSPTPDLYFALDDDSVPPPAKQLTSEVKFDRNDGASSRRYSTESPRKDSDREFDLLSFSVPVVPKRLFRV